MPLNQRPRASKCHPNNHTEQGAGNAEVDDHPRIGIAI